VRWDATIQGATVTVRVEHDEEGAVSDIHATIGKPGNPLGVALECVWRSASLSLRRGVPLGHVLKGLTGHGAPGGETSDPLVPWAGSVCDYVAKSVQARASA
jgi:hypothetical protein